MVFLLYKQTMKNEMKCKKKKVLKKCLCTLRDFHTIYTYSQLSYLSDYTTISSQTPYLMTLRSCLFIILLDMFIPMSTLNTIFFSFIKYKLICNNRMQILSFFSLSKANMKKANALVFGRQNSVSIVFNWPAVFKLKLEQ